MEVSVINNRPHFKLSNDYKESLREKEIIKNEILENSIVFNLCAFKLNTLGFANPFGRVASIAEEPFRIMYTLHNLSYYLINQNIKVVNISETQRITNDFVLTDNILIEQKEDIGIVEVHIRFSQSYVTLGMFIDKLREINIGIVEEHFLTHREFDREEVLIHSLTASCQLDLIYTLTNCKMEVEEVQYGIMNRLLNYYCVPVYKKIDLIHNFENGITLLPNQYVYNFEEILATIESNLKE